MELYAEITSKMMALMDEGRIELSLPTGVKFNRKNGSRVCYLNYDGELNAEEYKELLKEVGDQLDDLGINWQES